MKRIEFSGFIKACITSTTIKSLKDCLDVLIADIVFIYQGAPVFRFLQACVANSPILFPATMSMSFKQVLSVRSSSTIRFFKVNPNASSTAAAHSQLFKK